MLDIDKSDGVVAVNSLQDLANAVAAQSGNQIPQVDEDALIASVRQMMQLARCQPV